MTKNLQGFLMWSLIIISLLMLGAIYIWAPVCDGLLELANGNMVHMKCFYTAQASTILIILMLVLSITSLITKKFNVVNGVIIIALGIMLITVTYESIIGIGVCKKVMDCHETAFWLRSGGALTILIGLGTLFNKRKQNAD